MILPRLGRNKLFRALEQTDLDPTECDFDDADLSATIVHRSSGSTFEFVQEFESREFKFVIYAKVADGERRVYRIKQDAEINRDRGIYLVNLDAESLVGPLQEWANEVALVIKTPDLWQEARSAREWIAGIHQAESGNDPFTADDQRQISAGFQEVKELLTEQFRLTGSQLEEIIARFDEAEEATELERPGSGPTAVRVRC